MSFHQFQIRRILADIIRSPAIAKEALEANEAVFSISPVRRRAVGDDVGDVLNAEYVFSMPGYFGMCLVGRVRFVN